MSEKGSKEKLNESNMPLLSDDGAEKAGETPEKEEVELEEKKDEATEKEESKEDEKKKKKVKVPKVPKVPKPAGPSCVETMTTDLDMAARDKEGINIEIDVSQSL